MARPIGILFLKYGYRAIYDAASSIDAKESSVFKFRDLVWPPAKSEDLMCIQKQVKFDYNYAGRQTYLESRLLQNQGDTIVQRPGITLKINNLR